MSPSPHRYLDSTAVVGAVAMLTMRPPVAGMPTDASAQYRIHKMMLQAVQHGPNTPRWALKGFHAERLADLFAAYPDARYQDFSRDQVATIPAFYDFADQPWTEEAEGAMRNYLATNKGDRYGKFVYSTDLVADDIEDLHEEFAPYCERFGIDIERRG